jgi:hypothetical protein
MNSSISSSLLALLTLACWGCAAPATSATPPAANTVAPFSAANPTIPPGTNQATGQGTTPANSPADGNGNGQPSSIPAASADPSTDNPGNANPPTGALSDPNASGAAGGTVTSPVGAAVPPIPINYAVGRKWVYAYDFGKTAAKPSTLTISITALDAANVTWLVSRDGGTGQAASQTITYPKDGLTPFSFMGVASGTPGEQVTTSNEKVTVPAGAFDAQKTTIVDVFDGPSAKISTTIERWTAKDVGLVKQTTTSSSNVPSGSAAAGAAVSKIELDLQSFQ